MLSMELQKGDRITDETGVWEIISRPYVSAGGKFVSAQLRKLDHPEETDLRTWGANERVSMKRDMTPAGSSEKGKR